MSRFVHGVGFVPLAALTEPDLLEAVIADSLQLVLNQDQDLEVVLYETPRNFVKYSG